MGDLRFNVEKSTTIGELRLMLEIDDEGEALRKLDAMLALLEGRVDGASREQLLELPAVELGRLVRELCAALTASMGSAGTAGVLGELDPENTH